jgi:CRP-like cAMP-binding protein/rhodanese-related sulfurtransferase
MSTKTSYKSLRKCCYFAHLSDGALDALAEKLYCAAYPKGTVLIKEGTPAEYFYLISKGEVEISKKTKWGQEARMNVIGQDKAFGEMALITSSLRYCSVKAKTNVELLKLHKKHFKAIVNSDSVISRTSRKRVDSYLYFNQLKTLQPFALLDPDKMDALTDKLEEMKYDAGENIIIQGETGDKYYIIKSGKVAVLKKMLTDEPEYVATLEEGCGFGEEALIDNSKRNATVTAIDKTVVWTLCKSDFDAILKSSFLKEITPEEVPYKTNGTLNYIDVRMKTEFDEKHIPEAINIPLDEFRNRYSELDSSEQYYIYCLMGARSATAAFLMNSQGLKAKSIKGGILDWPGPVEEGSEGHHAPFKPT